MTENDEILTAAELAKRLKLSRQAVYNLANNGTIPTLDVGRHYRFCWSAVKEALLGNEDRKQ